ncbi:MAG: hypothetical protein U0Q22_11140 [Acidimicrobiales bacterium]
MNRDARPAILGALVGVPMLAYGVWGVLADADRTHPFELARWVIGADLAHDLLLAPFVVAIGWCIGRVLPPFARSPVRWAAATSGVLALIAWPFVRGYGRNESVPSLLDRNYARGLLVYVGAVWLAAAAWAALRARATHHRRDSTTTADVDSTAA